MRTKVTLADGSYINYTYDGLSRLTSESKSYLSGEGIYNAAYQYDNVGNRLNYSKTDYHGFNDDFNRANSLDVGGLWNETTGDWQIDNNRLFMPNAETDAVIIYSGQDIANPVIETTVRLETVGNKKGSYIVFGYQSRNDFYYAGLEGISDLWVMGHYQNGVYNDLITFSQPIEKLIDYHLRVTVKDNVATLENLENGVWVKKLSNNFGSLPTGKAGLSVEKSRTQFDDFKVTWQSISNTAYSYNQGNQLIHSTVHSPGLTDIDTTYNYDNNGNLIQKIDELNPTDYIYDYTNRLTGVIASGSKAIYTYDGLGKRISKSVNDKLTKYVYDSVNIIFAQTPQESITYTNSLAIDSPISIRGEVTAESYYHSDGLGSITNLTNSVGQSVQSYQYDAFGNMLSNQGNIPNPYAYTARELDSETGLYYYRNRYYDPKIGRFITQDPIGILDDINLYAYVGNNPVNFVDPWGLYQNYLSRLEKSRSKLLKILETEREIGTWRTLMRYSIGGALGVHARLIDNRIVDIQYTIDAALASKLGYLSTIITAGGWEILRRIPHSPISWSQGLTDEANIEGWKAGWQFGPFSPVRLREIIHPDYLKDNGFGNNKD